MFDFKYPSGYFLAVSFVIGIISLIVMITSFIISKVKKNQNEDTNKGKMGKILAASSIVFVVSVLYVCIFISISGKDSINTKIPIVFSLIVLAIIPKVKPNLGPFKQIFITLLIFALFLVPIIGALYCDNIVKEEEYRQETEAVNKMVQEIAYTEIDNGLSLDKIVKASGYNYVQWSGWYNNDNFYINASCKKNKDAPYDETLKFHFICSALTEDMELDYIRDIDGTVYSKEKSEEMFSEFVEKALKNED